MKLAVFPFASLGASLFLPLLAAAESSAPPIEPVRQLLYSPEQISHVRALVQNHEVMGKVAADFLRLGDVWLAYSDEQIRAFLPEPDAVFAYGFSGDPKENTGWPRLGEGGLCSLERPFAVVSPANGEVYGLAKEGEPFYDPGTGWIRPEDGKVFYFRGVWNAFAIRRLHEAVDWLSVSYMLTGKKAYAQRALYILDLMATARKKRKSVEGPIDFPEPLLKGYGFFSYYSNHANERMFYSALAFDLIGNAPFAKTPSSLAQDLTVFENIKENYFSVDAKGLYENRVSLQNHAIAGYSALLSQAVLFGRPEDLREGLEASYGFLNNTIDRDGEYYETSGSYSELGRVYGGRILSLLEHYAPERYAEPQKFPKKEEFPEGLKFGNMRAWRGAAVDSLYHLNLFERPVQYGDARQDRFTPSGTPGTEVYNTVTSALSLQRVMFLKLLYSQTTNPEWKRAFASRYWQLPEQARNDAWNLRKAILQYGPSQWSEPEKPGEGAPEGAGEEESIVLGQKRIALLKSGSADQQRGLFIRGGANNSHSHNDQLALQLYARKLSLTGQYGYNLWGTPDHRGYGTRGIAHQMAVVDEDLPAAPMIASLPAATIEGYLPHPPVQHVEMSNPGQWPSSQLSEYRRQTWLVDISDRDFYFLDVLWIEGGETHDYVLTAPYLKPARDDAFQVEGVEPRAQEGVWTLAALNGNHRNAAFNQPGKSWGERLEPGSGTMRKIGIRGEKINGQKWNPAPGNGYGFIWDVKAAKAEGPWQATWLLHDLQHRMKVAMLNPDGQTVVLGKAPSLVRDGTHRVAIARRAHSGEAPLESRFAAVTQVSESNQWPVREAKWLDATAAGNIGLELQLLSEETDIILISRSEESAQSNRKVKSVGKRALVRRNAKGESTLLSLSEGTLLEADGIAIEVKASAWTGTVKAVAADHVIVDGALPIGGSLAKGGVVFGPAAGADPQSIGGEFFTVEAVEAAGDHTTRLSFKNQSLVAANIVVEEVKENGRLHTRWPNELAAAFGDAPKSGVFDGRLMVSARSPEVQRSVVSYLARHELIVDDTSGMEPGDSYQIMATRPGDTFRIPAFATLRRMDSGAWEIRANMETRLKLNAPGAWRLSAEGKEPLEITPDADGFVTLPLNVLTNGKATLSQ